MAGKGDDRRPSAISEQELAARWHQTFGFTTRRRGKTRSQEAAARRIGRQELFTQAGPSEVAPK